MIERWIRLLSFGVPVCGLSLNCEVRISEKGVFCKRELRPFSETPVSPTERENIIYRVFFFPQSAPGSKTNSIRSGFASRPEFIFLHFQMFEDIAPNLNIQASHITRGKFLGKGTFGSVFRGELRQISGNSITIAMKMPLNNDANPTMELNDAYRWVKSKRRFVARKLWCCVAGEIRGGGGGLGGGKQKILSW